MEKSTDKTKPLRSRQRLISIPNQTKQNLPALEGYTTIKLLGQGGFGAVYLARHNETGKLVALKVMLPKTKDNQQAIDYFLREVENTRALHHPNVVQLVNYGYRDSIFFFTIEYCDGGTVDNLMRQRGGRLSLDETMLIILQTLDGLEYAHKAEVPYVKLKDGTFGKGNGLVHRDIKPANIFLSNIGGFPIAKVGDYGLSKAFDKAGLSGLTLTGTCAGTPQFMPRQQVLEFKKVKPEVDIWAVAATLYNMLTGAYPRNFSKGDPFLVVLRTDTVPIRQRDASIPKRLAEIIDLALVDNPEIHFKSASEFKEVLGSV